MPADTKPIDLAGLRVLLEKMTPRPWRQDYQHVLAQGGDIAICQYRDQYTNAGGIVAIVNAAGALLDRVEALEAGLREALNTWADTVDAVANEDDGELRYVPQADGQTIARLREEVARLQRDNDQMLFDTSRDKLMSEAAAERAAREREHERFMAQVEHTIVLQRLIEALARGEVPELTDDAPHMSGKARDAGLLLESARTSLAAALAERDALAVRVEAAERELERWRHEVPIEGDYVCPNALRADNAEAEADLMRGVVEAAEFQRDYSAIRDNHRHGDPGASAKAEDWIRSTEDLERAVDAYRAGTPAAAPRTVTREQVSSEWAEAWANRIARYEGEDVATDIVGRILADLGLQVEGDQGKETTP